MGWGAGVDVVGGDTLDGDDEVAFFGGFTVEKGNAFYVGDEISGG